MDQMIRNPHLTPSLQIQQSGQAESFVFLRSIKFGKEECSSWSGGGGGGGWGGMATGKRCRICWMPYSESSYPVISDSRTNEGVCAAIQKIITRSCFDPALLFIRL